MISRSFICIHGIRYRFVCYKIWVLYEDRLQYHKMVWDRYTIVRHNESKLSNLTHWSRDKMDATSQTTWNENVWIPITISLKCVPKGPINNIPALVQIMACHRPGDKPLSEPMMVSLSTHICVTSPQCASYVHSACASYANWNAIVHHSNPFYVSHKRSVYHVRFFIWCVSFLCFRYAFGIWITFIWVILFLQILI